ncbi:HdeD family acid-resistance protein [Streptomyces sp. NPDC002004]
MTGSPHPTMARESDPSDALGDLGGSWTWALGFGLITLVAGILILVWPNETLHILAIIIGLQLLLAGVFRFVSAFSRRGEQQGGRLPAVLVSALAVLAGVLVLRHQTQTVAVLALIVGAFWLVSGVLTAFVAISATDLPHRGTAFALAALGVVAGVFVLAFPVDSAVALTRLLGLWFVLLGLAEVAGSLVLRSALRRAQAP